jgi:phage shock protein C
MSTKLLLNLLQGSYKPTLKTKKMEKKLQRDEQNKTIAGVCAGLADYLSIDVTLVRIVFVLALVFHGGGFLAYIIFWVAMPKKIYGFNAPGFRNPGLVDYTVPPQSNEPIDYSVPNAFGNFSARPGVEFATQPKKPSNAGVIAGAALVAFGGFFLLNNFDLLPDWEFHRLWPIVIIVCGVILVFSRRKPQPWEKENWSATTQEEPAAAETQEEDKPKDTDPTV